MSNSTAPKTALRAMHSQKGRSKKVFRACADKSHPCSARFDICPAIVSVEEKHSQHKNFNFFFLLFSMEGNQTSVIESSDGDIKKLMASAVPESTKKSLKYAVNE